MAGTSGLPLAGVEAIVEGLSSFESDVRSMNSALDSIQPRSTMLQRGFQSLTEGIIGFGKGLLDWGVQGLVSFGEHIIHVAEYALGQLLSDAIEWAITKIKELISATIDAGSEFQTLELRLNAMNLQDLIDSEGNYKDASEEAILKTKEQLEWLQKLAATTPYDNTDISNVYTLARSYGFADEAAKQLTESTTNFASGMGLSGDHLERVIMNLGQMVQRGKITSTEIRDLARGAFMPINDILQRIADNMTEAGMAVVDNSAKIGKSSDQLEKYQDQMKVLEQREAEFTNKTKESTRMRLQFQKEELQAKIDATRTKIGALNKEQSAEQKVTMQQVMKKISTPEGLPAQLFIDAFNEMISEEPRFQGASERMARTFKAASDNAMDLVKSIGGLNVVKPILDVLGEKVASFVSAFTDNPERWGRLVDAAKRLGTSLSNIISRILNLAPSADTMAEGLIKAVSKAADWIETHGQKIVDFFKYDVYNAAIKVSDFIGKVFSTLKSAFLEFQKTGFSASFLEVFGLKPELAEKIISFVDGIRKALESVFTWLSNNGPLIKEFFSALGYIGSEVFKGILDFIGARVEGGGILDAITAFMKFVIENKEAIADWLKIIAKGIIIWQVVATVWNIVIGILIQLAGFVIGLVALWTGFNAIVAALTPILSALAPVLLVIATAILTVKAYLGILKLAWAESVAAWQAAIATIKVGMDRLKANFFEMINNIRTAFLNGDWVGIGMAILEGLAKGVALYLGTLLSAVGNAMIAAYNAAREVLGISSPSTLFAELGYFIMQGLAQGISNGIGMVIDRIQDAVSSVQSYANQAMTNLGIGASMGWAYGIQSAGQMGSTAITQAVQQTTQTAMNVLHAHSPSKVFEEIGAYTMEGFAQGIERAAGLAVGAMQNAVGMVAMPAVSSMAVAHATGNTINNTRTANLTINTSAPVEPIVQDFNMMSSLMGA